MEKANKIKKIILVSFRGVTPEGYDFTRSTQHVFSVIPNGRVQVVPSARLVKRKRKERKKNQKKEKKQKRRKETKEEKCTCEYFVVIEKKNSKFGICVHNK